MSLLLKRSISVFGDRKSLKVFDRTGVYGTTNTGGFGTPNPAIGTALTATTIITFPDGTVKPAIDLFPTLPNTNGIYFRIYNTDAGLLSTDVFPDGVYDFLYTVTGNDGGAYTATADGQIFISSSVACCVSQLAVRPGLETNPKKKQQKQKEYSDAFDLLELLNAAAACGKYNEANEYLVDLQLICESLNCQC